tara:strand:+ start:5341 stop:5541 length:201 start_codon:yes stop_codon:yes gene_type:complete
MSNTHNEEQLEDIHYQVVEWDKKGLLDTEVNSIAVFYNLHQDDDRDEILQHIAENMFYNKEEIILS